MNFTIKEYINQIDEQRFLFTRDGHYYIIITVKSSKDFLNDLYKTALKEVFNEEVN